MSEVESNADRKGQKLRARVIRQHRWRVQVWAQCERRIQAMYEELSDLGQDEPDLFTPDFEDQAELDRYTTLLQQ